MTDESLSAVGIRSISGNDTSFNRTEDPGPIRPHSSAKAAFQRYARKHDPVLREQLVRKHERLARYLASKFANRGEPLEDLVQVANLALIKSVDRFDPSRGLEFTTYATVTIVGEIQRHFRDTTWRVKVPRAMQELNLRAAKAKDNLAGRLGRQPTVADVAREIGTTEELTLQAIELDSAYSPASLDRSAVEEDGANLIDIVGADDSRIGSIVANDDLAVAIQALDKREQRIVHDYFFGEYTETEIAARLCISQMHVSRLKKKALATLKANLTAMERRVVD